MPTAPMINDKIKTKPKQQPAFVGLYTQDELLSAEPSSPGLLQSAFLGSTSVSSSWQSSLCPLAPEAGPLRWGRWQWRRQLTAEAPDSNNLAGDWLSRATPGNLKGKSQVLPSDTSQSNPHSNLPAPYWRFVSLVDSIANFHSSTHPDPGSCDQLPGEKDPSPVDKALIPRGWSVGCENELNGWERY